MANTLEPECDLLHLTPFHRGMLIVTDVKLVAKEVQVKMESRAGCPDISVHYQCTPHLAPKTGDLIMVYLEKAGADRLGADRMQINSDRHQWLEMTGPVD